MNTSAQPALREAVSIAPGVTRVALAVLTLALADSAPAERWLRFDDGSGPRYGVVRGELVYPADDAPWCHPVISEEGVPRAGLRVLPPTQPNVVLGAAFNYRSHLGGRPAPTKPEFFWKPPGCLVAHGEAIRLPPGAENAHYEAELVVVLGAEVPNNATAEEAERAIFGYTCGNDVSERTWAEADVQWWRAKGSDTFGPVGPEIVTGVDWRSLRVRGFHNGRLAQDEAASDMQFTPAELIAFASRHVRLRPGDLVFTASPGKTAAVRPGDTYEVRIDNVGVLRNPVEAARVSPSRRSE